MIIKSPFTDYYDHIAYLYGEPDKKITYDRTPLAAYDPLAGIAPGITVEHPAYEGLGYGARVFAHQTKYIVIAGKLFLVAMKERSSSTGINGKWLLVNEKNFPEYFYGTPEFQQRKERLGWRADGFKKGDFDVQAAFVKPPYQRQLNLAIGIQEPVFCISSWNSYSKTVTIEAEIPRLADYGFASLIDPQAMFQEIEYFLSTTVNGSPDTMPIHPMSNSEKIVSHGFDLKKSFRHRK